MSTHAAHGIHAANVGYAAADGRPVPPIRLEIPPMLDVYALDVGDEVTVTAGTVTLAGTVQGGTAACLIIGTANSVVRFPWASIDALRTARPVPAHPALNS